MGALTAPTVQGIHRSIFIQSLVLLTHYISRETYIHLHPIATYLSFLQYSPTFLLLPSSLKPQTPSLISCSTSHLLCNSTPLICPFLFAFHALHFLTPSHAPAISNANPAKLPTTAPAMTGPLGLELSIPCIGRSNGAIVSGAAAAEGGIHIVVEVVATVTLEGSGRRVRRGAVAIFVMVS